MARRKTNGNGSDTSPDATLAAIRDALLPRLLSGQIRVKDAEKVVETSA